MDFKAKVLDFVKHLTWSRLALYVVTATFAISAYTVWENRQNLFNRAGTSLNNTVDDFALDAPSKVGVGIVADFMARHPEVAMISVVDANPIANQRIVVYRAFNDRRVQANVEQRLAHNSSVGDGPLFTADHDNNKQVLSILNGEFTCSEVRPDSQLATSYPELLPMTPYSCRIPLPPSFGKATGWFSLLMAKPPATGEYYDRLKFESLMMSLNYYNLEVLKQGQLRSHR
jgi:hypothetical protein